MKCALATLALAACDVGAVVPIDAPPPAVRAEHAGSIAIAADGGALYVANPDADSISILDPHARTLVAEIPLGARPVVAGDGSYAPAIQPRVVALAHDGATLYVTGQRAGALFAVDLAARTVRALPVCSEPVGLAVAADDRAAFVACTQDDVVVRVALDAFAVTDRIAVPGEPWALGWSPSDGTLIATHFLTGAVTAIDPIAARARAATPIPAIAARGDRRLAHGELRGLYAVAARPHTDELWVPHVLLATDTAQPELDFESTVFPAVSIVHAGGGAHATLSTDALAIPGVDGAFGDVVSGPRALAFTGDGALALVVDTDSEDVLAIDAARGTEAALLRPLPGHLPEGLVLAPDDAHAYVDERNSGDVAVIAIARDPATGAVTLAVDGEPIPRFASGDPMPADLRLGQQLFYSANSDVFPITRNHWVACASCHLEGRSDAVTWRFEQGPRDTPSNAGGTRGTGFLLRTADRTRLQDYWHTIDIEQGGTFDPVAEAPLLDAIAAYVDRAIPLPIPPTTDPARVAAGKAIFERADVGCASCHHGPRLTDSGDGNPTLDLAGPIVLHDVGTCATAPFADAAHLDVAGHPRDACRFDTPSLAGVASTPPYLHDGRAATLRDALVLTRGTMGDITALSPAELDDLVEYLRSL